jgi:hypothetical protein
VDLYQNFSISPLLASDMLLRLPTAAHRRVVARLVAADKAPHAAVFLAQRVQHV